MVTGGPADRVPPGAPPEPLAVIGLSCRFPGGADSPDSFWELLTRGTDATRDGADRWAAYTTGGHDTAAVVRGTTSRGGFLHDIEGFDAAFFGISRREAELMDPQQRLLLELAWEAFEHAGIPPLGLAGSDCGVFVGVGSDDYGRRLLEDLPGIEPWTGIGAALCATANRISHSLDLRGPSLAVDTACSSSLVGVHLACQSLRSGESGLALAAGVNLMVAPGLSVTLDRAGATSPDGRSKSFDAAADGYGRGEGAGVLVLKRLADARRAGDPVLAVIRGSAVSQDGHTEGIMAPSGTAQAELLRRAYASCGIDPRTVDYVEAHGTGTVAGDPLEASALAAVLGAGRPAGRPCLIGSVKSNIGHLEAGSGMAGMIKTVLALRRAEIPPTLRFSGPNPAIPWADSGLRLTADRTPWPPGDRPRRAGVSSFGYGGTIAHVVLEEAPAVREEPAPGPADAVPRLFPLSARSGAAGRADAGRLADWLSGPGAQVPLGAVGHTLGSRRSHLEWRSAVVATGHKELTARLRGLAEGDSCPGTVTGGVPAEPGPGPVWVFSGHGAQWSGMGRDLLAGAPGFAAAVDRIGPAFAEELGVTARQLIEAGDIARVDLVQPMLFAVQLGLAAVWQSLGVRPAAVIGHSVGEIAAAVVAGMLSEEDGARLVCRRSALLRRVAGAGGMLMVGLPADAVAARLGGTGLVPAILASPHSTVVAGDTADIEAVAAALGRDEELVVRRVATDVAFHSPHMDPLLDELVAAAAQFTVSAPRVPVYSTALDDPRDGSARDGAYWAANLRNPVRFRHAVQAAAEDGFRVFLEVSAHPVTGHSLQETLEAAGAGESCVAGSLRRDRPEREQLLLNAGLLHCHGVPLDWPSLHPGGPPAPLPNRTWHRQRYWREPVARDTGRVRPEVSGRTLLGSRVTLAGSTPLDLWSGRADRESRPYPGSHTIQGVEIVPASVVLETFLRAGPDRDGEQALRDVAFAVPLTLEEAREIDVIAQDGTLRLHSRAAGPEPGDETRPWLTHATARRTGPAGSPPVPSADAGPGTALSPDLITRHLASVGVPGMAFPWQVHRLERTAGGLRAEVTAPDGSGTEPPAWAPLFDAALSIVPAAFSGPAVLRVVSAVARTWTAGRPPVRARIDVTVTGSVTAADAGADVRIADEDGRTVAVLEGVRYAGSGTGLRAAATPDELLHRTEWRPLPGGGTDAARAPLTLLLTGPDGPLRERLRSVAAAAGHRCLPVVGPEGLDAPQAPDGPVEVLVLPAEDTGGAQTAGRAGTGTEPDGGADGLAARNAWLLARTAQRMAAWPPGAGRLWSLTTGVREARDLTAVAQAARWGLGRVIAGEHPEIWGGTLDLGPDGADADLRAALEVIARRPDEDVIALRDGTPLAARLVRAAAPTGPTAPFRCRPDGSYLITGGLGSLGGAIGRRLVDRGARRLVLLGRGTLPPRTAWSHPRDADEARRIETVRGLEALGATVRVLSADIADTGAVAAALHPDALDMPPVRGVVHAAGVLDDRLLGRLDQDSLRAVLRPKAGGALTLARLFPPGSLDFLVHFSSCGQLLGLTGQAAYASANAFLDAMAVHDRARGASGTMSLGWTSWRGMGMAVNEAVDAELRASGVGDIAEAEAFGAWERAAGLDEPHLAVLRTVPLPAGATRPRLLADLATDTAEGPGPAGSECAGGIWELPPDELRARLHEETVTQVAQELRLDPAELEPDRSLLKSGMDSVLAIVIRRRLEARLGRKLPANLIWHRQTVAAVVDYLVDSARP
ncbi:beta-ketoacyl synthase N-terminal-like domain-containing protein [Streptomyces sp. NPDC002055]|uniref:type I polyketide synthase n=1 Tax=Streptomyces sp. NPDC002055 TaxID=3154534 RepID=UPI00332B5C44